jgi:hypothetical protein
MFAQINHPNWGWGLTAEDIARVRGLGFLEIYNGHPGMNNLGDAAHLGAERMWDVALTLRLATLGLPPLFALAVDDAHHFHALAPGKSNAGRGWVMVRSPHLTPESIVHAMAEGDFYASTGVVLTDVRRHADRLALEIAADPGVSYVIQFIGTRRGFNAASEPLPTAPGEPAPTVPHRRYGSDIGTVLAETRGTSAVYRLQGDELYVRARIVSSQPKPNGSVAGEFECAWTQPLVPAASNPPLPSP